MSKKIKLISTLVLIGFIIIWIRVLYLQVFTHKEFSRLARSQYQNQTTLIPKRGQILAFDGIPLAKSLATTSAQKYIRAYPEGSSSGYLTGFVGKDIDGLDTGYFGLEGYFDRQLKGKIGHLNQETDVFNKPILIGDVNYFPPQDGSNIITSIDTTLQYFVVKALREALILYQAEGGTVTVMESSTGHILAMTATPGYDSNFYTQYQNENFVNPIITAAFEPGSTFKPLVMAAALNDKVINLNTICDVCNRPMVIGEWTIKSYNDKYYPDSTLYDIILHSDNVGMSFISRKLGKKRMISYLKDLNFGQKTGIELQEESSPPLKSESDWYEIDLATASFGQGIAITRLQMISAINSLANKGVYIPPSIALHIESTQGNISLPEKNSHRVYSKSAAEAVVNMMVNGVEKGEVRYYKPKGYTIAGKTGTAQVPIAGHYDPNRVISSYVGFAPANQPKFTMLVTLDNPKTSPWGSTTAAPLWFRIASEILNYYHIPPG